MRVSYRPRDSVTDLGTQYFRYGRWRRVVSRQHAGTINLRYLAPPATVAAVTAGTLAGLAGLAGVAAGATGSWPSLLTIGFVIPAGYLAGIAAVSARAARQLSWRTAARLPMTLITMHMCWGTGFLTSPRRLLPAAGEARSVSGIAQRQ